MDWFEIFRTGEHTDSSGNTSIWTERDLDRIVALYDPGYHEAPIVIGHPETDSPAYGWIEALKREGDRLLAKPKQLVNGFMDWVKNGVYKKVSVALYPDLSLRHVGFLGGMPPAVKGLAPVQFRAQAKIICFSDFNYKEVFEMSNSNRDPGKEIQHRVKEILRDPTRHIDKYGRRFLENMTYSEALTFVQQEDPELAREYAESLHPTKLSESEKRSLAAGQKIVEFVNQKMKADKSLTYAEALTEVQMENRDLILVYIGRK